MSVSRGGISPYGGSHFEQFGAQSQASMLNSTEVDFKADLFPFEDELDHAATLRELRHVTDGQNSLFVEGFDDFAKSAVLRGAHEKNVASGRFLRRGDSFGCDTLSPYCFACKGGIQSGPKGVLTENTDGERVTVGCDTGRPFDEAAEIIEIGGLNVVVGRS